MALRTRLLVLVLAALIPMMLVAAFGIKFVYDQQHDSFRKGMRETTHALALLMDAEFQRQEAILQTFVTASRVQIDNGEIGNLYQKALLLASTTDSTFVLSDKGRNLFDTRAPLSEANANTLKVFPKLRAAYGREVTLVSDLFYQPSSKSWDIAVQVPVRQKGEIRYFLAVGSPANRLQVLFKKAGLPAEWYTSIVDRNGRIVARNQEPEKYVGSYIGDARLNHIRQHPEGFVEATSMNDDPTLTFFSRAPLSEWTLLVSVPQHLVRKSAFDAVLVTGLASLALLLLAVMAVFGVARGIAQPTKALRDAAARLADGRYENIPASNIAEIDAVSKALNRAGEDIRETRGALERKVEETTAVAERLQRTLLQSQKLEAVGRMTGGIAHDFNNVLQTLGTALQMIHLSTEDKRIKSSLEVCHHALKKAGTLTTQLLAFGQTREARMEIIELGPRIRSLLPMLEGGLPGDIELELDIDEALWPVRLDVLQLELALLNVTMNARDAMPRGGHLRIAARNIVLEQPQAKLQPGSYVRLSVVDTGLGMDAEVAARAFELFFTTKPLGKGAGMGLQQAKEFSEACGGSIALASEPGKGTEVVFMLPKAEAQPVGTPPPQERRSLARSSGTVLFVEDDELICRVVPPLLEAAGLKILVSRDGDEALGLLDSGREVDVVFSDIVMPGKLSGIELAQIVRRRYPAIDVILATGYADRWAVLPGIKTIAKPYDVADVVDAINVALQNRPENAAAGGSPD